MRTRIVAVLVLLCVVAVVVLLFFRLTSKRSVAKPHTGKADTVYVETDTVRVGSVEEVLHFTGTLEGINQTMVVSQTGGLVQSVQVKVGDRCRKEQVLAIVDNGLQKAALDQAEAQVMAAETNYQKAQRDRERVAKLFADSVVTETDLESVNLNVKAALAQLKSAQAARSLAEKQYDDTYIKASIGGTIASRKVTVGQMTAPGSEIAVIVDESRFKLKIAVSETDIGTIRPAQQATVMVDAAAGASFTGAVQTIGSIPEQTGRAYPVEIILDPDSGKQLKAGMFARCAIVTKRKTGVLIVAEKAITIGAQGDAYTYVLSGGKAKRTPVSPGIKDKTGYEILAGLAEHTVVATTGKEQIKEGVAVMYGEKGSRP